jgi:hypothetical protein
MESPPRPLSGKFILNSFILGLSFANLCFMNILVDLPNRQDRAFRKYLVTSPQVAALLLDVLLLTVVLWTAVLLVAKSGNRTWIRILKWSVLIGLMLPLNILLSSNEVAALKSLPLMHAVPVRILLGALGMSAGLWLLWRWEKLSTKVTPVILVVLAPMMPLGVARVAWSIYTGPPAGHLLDRHLESALPQKAGAPHVLWLLFDEWDESLTYRHRPANLELPELDRFRNQSFHAERAFPPGRETIISVPSLLLGKTFIDTHFSSAGKLLMVYDRKQPSERISAEPSVFSEARGLGFNVGIVGFALPYCRWFGATYCEWNCAVGVQPEEWERPLSIGRLMVLMAKRQVGHIPFTGRLGITRAVGDTRLNPSAHTITYQQTHQAAFRAIVDSRLNLVFVHWNVPHLPAIYDAAKDGFSNDRPENYADNLRLTDRTLRDIRLTLENAGLWDSSTILVTADHPLRLDQGPKWMRLPRSGGNLTQATKVPFLLKMAGQKQGLAYDTPMQTVVTKDLLLAIMKGEITQPGQVAGWLDRRPPCQ